MLNALFYIVSQAFVVFVGCMIGLRGRRALNDIFYGIGKGFAALVSFFNKGFSALSGQYKKIAEIEYVPYERQLYLDEIWYNIGDGETECCKCGQSDQPVLAFSKLCKYCGELRDITYHRDEMKGRIRGETDVYRQIFDEVRDHKTKADRKKLANKILTANEECVGLVGLSDDGRYYVLNGRTLKKDSMGRPIIDEFEYTGTISDVPEDAIQVIGRPFDEVYIRPKSTGEGNLYTKNLEVFEREMRLAGSIERKNRHSSIGKLVWFGPDPEPQRFDLCECSGCQIRRATFEKRIANVRISPFECSCGWESPCMQGGANVCVAEGCFGHACMPNHRRDDHGKCVDNF